MVSFIIEEVGVKSMFFLFDIFFLRQIRMHLSSIALIDYFQSEIKSSFLF
jgi:hypothetical protein